MPVCPHCGHDTPDAAARFCAACGRVCTRARESTEAAAETTSMLNLGGGRADADAARPNGRGRARSGSHRAVERRDGAARGSPRPSDRCTFLARRRRHDSWPPSRQRHLSRRHHGVAASRGVQPRRSEFRLRDMGSLNGTYVNRSRIDDAILVNGDEVQIGKYRMLYLSGGDQAVASNRRRTHEPGSRQRCDCQQCLHEHWRGPRQAAAGLL